MTTFTITSRISGITFGEYTGETIEQAIESMHRDMGYRSTAAAAEALSVTADDLRAELRVEECETVDSDDSDDDTDDSYRAAYWLSADSQSEVVLTGPEHASLDDDALEAEALAEARRAGLELDGGRIVIGTWRESV
jgi:hypothetical protein